MQQVTSFSAHETATTTKAAFRMALGTLVSRIFGLLRDIVLAALFSRLITDAFVVAFRLPNFFRRLLGEGSIAGAFTPLYMAESGARAVAFRRAVFLFLFSVSATFTAIGIVFMRPLLTALVASPEFMAVPGKFALTLLLARAAFGFLFLVTNYAFLLALAQAHGRFFWPALAPAFFNLSLIAAAFLSKDGEWLGYGILFGGAAQALVAGIAVWPLLRGLFERPADAPAVSLKPFLARLGPTILGLGGAQAIALLNIYFGARLPAGTLSYFYLADRLLELPLSLVAVSLGSALLPTLAALWQQKNHQLFTDHFLRHLEILLLLVLPGSLGLGLLAKPIVAALFQHGQFAAHEVETTAAVLLLNSGILIFLALTRLMVVALHAMASFRGPALISLGGAVLHFILATALIERYGLMGVMGAGLVSAAAIALGNSILFLRLLSSESRLRLVQILRFALRLSPALLFLTGSVLFTNEHLGIFGQNVAGLGLTILVGAAIYFFTCKLMGVFRHLKIAAISE